MYQYFKRYILLIITIFFYISQIGCSVTYSYLKVHDFFEGKQLNRKDGSVLTCYIWDRTPKIHEKSLFIFIQGSEYSSVVSNYKSLSHFNYTAYKYIPNDYVFVLCDKRGVTPGYYGKGFAGTDSITTEYLDHENIFERAEDYALLVRSLKSIPEYMDSKVIIAGASEGAIVASYTLRLLDYAVDGLILISGGGSSFMEDIFRKKELGPETSSYTILTTIINNPVKDKMWHGHTYYYWKDHLQYRPLDDLLKFNNPLFVIHGELDDPARAYVIEREFKKHGKKNLTMKIYPNSNHRLIDESTGISYDKDYLEKIFLWLATIPK